MPREPEGWKRTVAVVVNGRPIPVVLHPPAGACKIWYADWSGAVYKRSTGQTDFDEAVKAPRRWWGAGKKARVEDAVLTDADFETV